MFINPMDRLNELSQAPNILKAIKKSDLEIMNIFAKSRELSVKELATILTLHDKLVTALQGKTFPGIFYKTATAIRDIATTLIEKPVKQAPPPPPPALVSPSSPHRVWVASEPSEEERKLAPPIEEVAARASEQYVQINPALQHASDSYETYVDKAKADVKDDIRDEITRGGAFHAGLAAWALDQAKVNSEDPVVIVRNISTGILKDFEKENGACYSIRKSTSHADTHGRQYFAITRSDKKAPGLFFYDINEKQYFEVIKNENGLEEAKPIKDLKSFYHLVRYKPCPAPKTEEDAVALYKKHSEPPAK